MKRILLSAIFGLAAHAGATAEEQPRLLLHYDRPADFFEESLPIGNGKTGALIYGGSDDNILYLNDITLWTGKPMDRNLDAGAYRWIPKIREALFREDYRAADSLQLHVQGPNSQYFQPLGTLHIKDLNLGAVSGYTRRLDLDSAIVTDSYLRDGRKMEREYFASNPDHLIAVRLRGCVNVRLALTAQIPHQVKVSRPVAAEGQQPSATQAQLTMTGHALGQPQSSIHFCTMLKVVTNGHVNAADSSLTISGATEATVYIVNETSFNGFDKDPVTEGAPYLENAANALWHTQNYSYEAFRQRHVADYQQLYDRVKLRLGGKYDATATQNDQQPTGAQRPQRSRPTLPSYRALTTDRLLKAYADSLKDATADKAANAAAARYLETLYFQYGRYLLIACSRTPAVPANLQGLWTPHLWSPWRGNYTMNINLEENYWLAFNTNLAELAEPLDGFSNALAKNGHFTAKNYYGISRGWCASHNSDIWAMTNPVGEKNEKPEWANWNLGGAWMMFTLWDRFLFTQDKNYLKTVALPLMRGAADFCLDWLTDNPRQRGELITAPSTSPENEYKTTEGYHGMTCYGGTADLAIIRELFTATIAASRLCGGSTAAYEKALRRLHPYTIGKNGDLNEWYYDWEDWDPLHRHQSHLIGLYPGSHLLRGRGTTEGDALLKACEQTLIQKGDNTTGWSTGWRINLWARLRKAPQAYHILQRLLTFVTPDNYHGPDRRHSGGTYPNLFDAHPPFQIDGNFGGTAGICEMLLQSTAGTKNGEPDTIELLPATPEQWSEGAVSGLCARGGYEISMAWANGRVTTATIKAKKAGTLRLIYNGQQQLMTVKQGQTLTI